MSLPPIVPMAIPGLSSDLMRLAEQTASELTSQFPSISLEPEFQHLAAQHIDSRPTLHCDDLSEIMRAPGSNEVSYLQERARLRAIPGDFVATSFQPNAAYNRYCAEQLGLGPVNWITPEGFHDAYRLAEACWQDRRVRTALVHAIRNDGLSYIHPHYGTKAIWELALLLQKASHMPVSVIGAPPGLAAFVNDKGKFATLVQQVFGDAALPPTKIVWNKALAAEQLCDLRLDDGQDLSIKLPSASGGEGNLVLASESIRGKSSTELRELLVDLLPDFGYEVGDELIVSVWETNVLAAPSVQYWLPPSPQGLPIFEGLYKQFVAGKEGSFVGSAPYKLPDTLQETAIIQTQVLVQIFQNLGYIGRCSFDFLVVGQSMKTASLHFIECNGRWGGTSLPMSFLNQIFGSWHDHPYAVFNSRIEEEGALSFSKVLHSLQDDIFDRRTSQGQYILLNPQRIEARREVTVVSLADSAATMPSPIHFKFGRTADETYQ